MPLFLLGVALAIYINLMQAAIPFVVPSRIVGTAMGLQSSFQNLGLMTLTYVFSKIHDATKATSDGYYWSVIAFLVLSLLSFVLKIKIGMWDKGRGSILNSKTPYQDFISYQ